jgi:hypothetical protein
VSGDTLDTEARFAVIPEWVLYAPIPDRAVRLYAILARHANADGVGAFPSRKRLAGMLGGCSIDTVDRTKGELVGIGAISVTARFRENGGQTSNGYTLRVVPPAAPVRPPRRTDAAGPGRTDAAPITRTLLNESQESLLPADADEEEFGIRLALSAAIGVDLDRMTKRERGQWDLAVRELAAAGATADDVTARCAAYRRIWPDARLTPLAISKHWSTLGAEVQQAKAGGFDGWLEQAPSRFSREMAHEIVDDAQLADLEERARRHLAIDERFDELDNERSKVA